MVSASVPAVTRRWFGMPTSRMMMSLREQRLERRVRIVHSAEQHEVRGAVVHGVAELRQLDEHAVALRLMSSTIASIAGACASAATAAACVSADRWYGRRTSAGHR